MKLSILILTIEKRSKYLEDLLKTFSEQLSGRVEVMVDLNYKIYNFIDSNIEIIVNYSENLSIGEKRNNLLEIARGKYLYFFDDDDMPSNDNIETILKAIETNPDCVSLRGIMTTNGSNPEIFEHSIQYKAWKTTKNKIKYERFPNHLNCIRADIAKQFKFPEVNHGEDFAWSKAIHESGLLKKEFYVDSVLYYYKYITNK